MCVIVAVVTGISTAAILGARARAKMTACSQNLAAIGKAMHLYAADHDDQIAPYMTFSGGLRDNPTVPARCDLLLAAYGQYGVVAKTWRCPSANWSDVERMISESQCAKACDYQTSGRIMLLLDQQATTWNFRLSKVDDPSKRTYLEDLVVQGVDGRRLTSHGEKTQRLRFDGSVKVEPVLGAKP